MKEIFELAKKQHLIGQINAEQGFNNEADIFLRTLSLEEIRALAAEENSHLLDELYEIALSSMDDLTQRVKAFVDTGQQYLAYGPVPVLETTDLLEELPAEIRNKVCSAELMAYDEDDFQRMARRILFRNLRLNIWVPIIRRRIEEAREGKQPGKHV